jgi:hypothetical protein
MSEPKTWQAIPWEVLHDDPIRDFPKLQMILSQFGRDQPTEEEIEYYSYQVGFAMFSLSFIQKVHACQLYKWDKATVKELQRYHLTTDLANLEPLTWDDCDNDYLFMYHPKEGSFWAWCNDERIEAKDRLIRVGYKWTDIICHYPMEFFNDQIEKGKSRLQVENK